MSRYEYRCVNAPVGFVVKKATDRDNAIRSYEDIINKEAAEGWEYVGMDSYTTEVKPGCLFFFMPRTEATHRMLVFRRQVGG